MKRIVLISDIEGPQHYHVGDEAMFSARCDWLKERFPSAEIIGISADPAFTSMVHGISSVKEPGPGPLDSPRLPEALRPRMQEALGFARVLAKTPIRKFSRPKRPRTYPAYALPQLVRDADVLYISGGGNLASIFPGALLFRSFLAMLAQSYEVPVVVSGQTLGPIASEEDRNVLRRWLPKVHYLGLRDRHFSSDLAHSLGVPSSRIGIRADDAFFLRADKDSAVVRRYTEQRRPLVGVSFHRRGGSRVSAEVLIAQAARILDRFATSSGVDLLFIPHVTSSVARRKYDLEYAFAIRERMSNAARLHIAEELLLDREVKALTACCEYVVSTRYHPLVFALSSGIPAIGVAQDEHTDTKLFGVFDVLGVKPHTVDIRDAAADEKIVRDFESRMLLKSQLVQVYQDVEANFEREDKRIAAVIERAGIVAQELDSETDMQQAQGVPL